MQERNLFEYAVIRVVPRVEREEFLNVGVILYCASQKFLKCAFELNENRMKAFSSDIEAETILANLESIAKICCGATEGGAIGQLDMPSRFRWLTATRSTIVQTSKVHPGFCLDAEATLQNLFKQLVL